MTMQQYETVAAINDLDGYVGLLPTKTTKLATYKVRGAWQVQSWAAGNPRFRPEKSPLIGATTRIAHGAIVAKLPLTTRSGFRYSTALLVVTVRLSATGTRATDSGERAQQQPSDDDNSPATRAASTDAGRSWRRARRGTPTVIEVTLCRY